jgi:hypothetical protein
MQLASGAQAFLPTQFGLSCFVWEGGAYAARTFNFFLFPQPLLPGLDKRFSCQVLTLYQYCCLAPRTCSHQRVHHHIPLAWWDVTLPLKGRKL